MGLLSMMFAAGIAPALVLGRITFNVLGATPNEHCSIAVDTTCWPTVDPFTTMIRRSVIFRSCTVPHGPNSLMLPWRWL